MAKVILVGVDQAAAEQLRRAFAADRHQIAEQPLNALIGSLLDTDIVFAGGDPACYMALLKRLRDVRPSLPFVVVTRIPETKAWLDAIEAGATDYCSVPIETRQLRWLMESALPRAGFAAG